MVLCYSSPNRLRETSLAEPGAGACDKGGGRAKKRDLAGSQKLSPDLLEGRDHGHSPSGGPNELVSVKNTDGWPSKHPGRRLPPSSLSPSSLWPWMLHVHTEHYCPQRGLLKQKPVTDRAPARQVEALYVAVDAPAPSLSLVCGSGKLSWEARLGLQAPPFIKQLYNPWVGLLNTLSLNLERILNPPSLTRGGAQ